MLAHGNTCIYIIQPFHIIIKKHIPNIRAWQVEKTMAGWVLETEFSTVGERDVRFTRSDARQGTQH